MEKIMKLDEESTLNKKIACFVILLASALLVRLFILVVSDPILFPDSNGYIHLAEQILRMDLSQDNGARTPLYPLLLILCGLDLGFVRLVQMGLGLCITAMLFLISWHLTHQPVLSTFVGACYALNLSQIQYESSILTETLTTFWIVQSFLFLSAFWSKQGRGMKGRYLFLASLCGALAGLTRPLFVFLPMMIMAIGCVTPKVAWRWRVLSVLPVVILSGGWSLFNLQRFGYLSPTTLVGYNLTNHSGAFMEYAPERYALLRDTYLQARQYQIARTGSHTMTIWRITDQLMERTGRTYAQVSQDMTRLSVELFSQYPFLYGQSVAVSWVQFWNAPGWWQWPETHSEAIGRYLGYVWRLEKYLVVFLNLLFLLLVCLAILTRGLLRKWQYFYPETPFLWTAIVFVLSASVLQALLERGENARYAIPAQPIISLATMLSVWLIWSRRWGLTPSNQQ
jgi:hypothetical protein